MIPLRLHLHNFLCYRHVPPLEFGGIHLACLAGDNGSGKSALLDAMTWALWGRARARRDDELIHHGETEMEVEFEFSLGEGRYRVIRKRDARGRGQSVLEFHGWDESLRRFRPLTGPTMRDTQASIDDLLRMDYDTFINSAFLLQGRADEFTVKPPGERKRILGEILGLGVFDALEAQAKTRARACKEEIALLEARIAEIDSELALRSTFESDLEGAQAEAARLSVQVGQAEAARDAVRARQRTLEVQQGQLVDLEHRLAQARRELAEIDEQTTRQQAMLAEDEALIARGDEIGRGVAAYQATREQADALSLKAAQLLTLNERREKLAAAVADARRAIESERDALTRQVVDLSARAGQAPALRADLEQVQGRLAHLSEREAQQKDWREELARLVAEMSALGERNERLLEDMQPLREHLDALQAAEAVCPFCQQTLSAEHRNRVAAELQRQGKEMGDTFRDNRTRLEAMQARQESLARNIQAVDGELRARQALQHREGALAKSLEEAEAAAAALTEYQEHLAAVEVRLAEEDYAVQERTALQALLLELDALGYDTQAHQEAQARLASLADWEAEKARLDAALARREQWLAALVDLQARRRRLQDSLAADTEKRDRLDAEVQALSGLGRQLVEAQKRLDELQTQERLARDRMVAARQKLAHCEYLANQREEKTAEQKKLAQEQAILDELRLAFGRQGVQALIIENAAPDIEDEANTLLSRMTDGRMSVHLETQRQTQRGEARETLDIHISDERGTRSYELYSGGEKFRVNFAVRIALSKLLARRAGASLQTLVIDEGFGSQDAEGRGRLVEAINAIKDDFARILVVTHIDELKDAFTTRIDVWKTPQGSQFAVN
ncbi:MAG: AAA family ATPase [Chloroflexota bacterium]